MSVLHQVCRSS